MSPKLKDNISSASISIEDWRELELITLNYIICTEKKFFENYNPFFIEANQLVSDLNASKQKKSKKNKKSEIKLPINFHGSLDIIIEGEKGKAFIGITEQHTNTNLLEGISYYLILGKKISDNEIYPLRKFHFDYITNETKIDNPHPVYHLQYGGNLPPILHDYISENDYNEKIDPWLSSPRIFFPPFSLGLILNILFIEFPDPINEKIIRTGEWINLIKKIEKQLLEPYYQELSDFIQKRSKNKKNKELLINDFLYFQRNL